MVEIFSIHQSELSSLKRDLYMSRCGNLKFFIAGGKQCCESGRIYLGYGSSCDF